MSLGIPSRNEIEESIIELFRKANGFDRILLWRAVIPIDPALDKYASEGKRAISFPPLYEWQEVKLFVRDFEEVLRNAKDDHGLQARIMMIVYCHILEADFPFAVIWNLLRVINEQPESWIFTIQSKKGDLVVCEYPSQKISDIHRLSNELGLKIGGVINDLWNADLRNSFSHSQYSINDHTILYTKDISPISRKPSEGMPHGKGVLGKQDLEKYYRGACTLIEAFDREYEHIHKKVTLQNNGMEADSQ